MAVYARGILLASLLVSLSSVSALLPFNELLFVQCWAPSICLQTQLQEKHKCAIPENVTTWGIHGLWPTEGGTYGPNFCNRTDQFDPSRLDPIRDQLLKYWPDLFTDTKGNAFWKHEWTKHGTCAEEIETLSNEFKYFSNCLKFNRKFDILTFFSNSGIMPSDTGSYQVGDMEQAIEKVIGQKPRLQCFLDTATGKQYLIQIEICLDVAFQVIRCKTSAKKEVNWLLETKRSWKSHKADTHLCDNKIPATYIRIHH